jgi:hypothetical protein
MTRSERPSDRRRQPRIRVHLPLRLTIQDRTVTTLIEDLSSSGIRFRTPAPLPLLTRVQIALELPHSGPAGEDASMAITGVVVRCDLAEADQKSPYDTAIYFEDLSERARGQLAQFVSAQA